MDMWADACIDGLVEGVVDGQLDLATTYICG